MIKILCPTDFSDAANNAVVYAARLAQIIESEITLFSVQWPFEYATLNTTKGKMNSSSFIMSLLEGNSKDVHNRYHIPCHAGVQSSVKPLDRIIDERAMDFDLIVMGISDADDIYQLLFETNIYNAIKKTKTPLLLIPELQVYNEVKVIMYAFDYLKAQQLPLSQLLKWVRIFKSELSVLQILEDAPDQNSIFNLKRLQRALSHLYGNDVLINYHTINASISDATSKHAIESECDILALCMSHHHLFEQLFHKNLSGNDSSSITCPVLVFHASNNL